MPAKIRALTPRNNEGHQFVCYADCCSGVPGTDREATFAAVNAVIAKLEPRPEFICFPGDEIRGLTADEAALRRQWDYWFKQEMAWLDRDQTPLYHTTGNHTAYDRLSDRVYRDVMAHLPQNGPPDQTGFSYYVRRDDLLLVFVNTMGTGIGGEGRVETDWLAQTLASHDDAKYKFVIGHHPAFAVNGFSGAFQRQIDPQVVQTFWQILVQHQVMAYLCSHMLAFDVQVHQGVLQILTAGAGTPYLMPEDSEYHHCVQLAVDDAGLQYQVLDTTGTVRESLRWPPSLPDIPNRVLLAPGVQDAPYCPNTDNENSAQTPLLVWQFSGILPAARSTDRQTFVTGWNNEVDLTPFWIGLAGPENQLWVQIWPAPGRSPHLWYGPKLTSQMHFKLQLGFHPRMGPGGLLWRWQENVVWSSLMGASAWGVERLLWPTYWCVGHGQYGQEDSPFQGQELQVSFIKQISNM